MLDIDPFRPVVVWQSADCPPVDPSLPVFRHDYDDLHAQCVRAVARREQSYPELVAAGRMDRADADRDLAAWRELAAEWLWIRTGEGECPPVDTLPERIAAVDLAAERLDAELQRGRTSQANLYQRHLLEALRWHLRPESRVRCNAALTRTLRAEMRASSERKVA